MYHLQPRVKDAQNPYRTGVLIGNYTEDKFGIELSKQPVRQFNLTHRLIRNPTELATLKTGPNSRLTRQLLHLSP